MFSIVQNSLTVGIQTHQNTDDVIPVAATEILSGSNPEKMIMLKELTKDVMVFPIAEYKNGHKNGFHGSIGTNGHFHEHALVDPAQTEIEAAVRTILRHVGEDPDRQGLQGTPDRIARMYDEILAGYDTDLEKLVNGALFDVTYDEMVLVKDIEFFSMCEHHMLPFHGRAHVAYLPSDKVIGLSKIPRIVDMFARRLQVQERMTRQIAETIEEVLGARGVAVVVEGAHMCSMMRGVKKEHARMTTSALLGDFKTDESMRDEFFQHLRRQYS